MGAPPEPPARLATETTGEGQPLVLIHGVGTNRSIWQRSLPLLSPGRAVTTLDLPGFGDSPPPERWELGPIAELLAEQLERRVEPPWDLIGSSLGGAVAIVLARQRPDLLRRLILAAPAGFRPAPGPLPELVSRLAGPYLALRRQAGLRLAESSHGRRAFLAGTVADGGALDPDAARLVWRASERSRSLRAAMSAAAGADLRETVSGLEVRFGLLWGTLDRVIPAHTAERVLELAPDTPLELIAGAGHIPHLERPGEFVQASERLFEQL